MAKTANSAEGVGVSERDETTAATAQTATENAQALAVSATGDVTGPIELALSSSERDEIIKQFREKLHRVKEGFANLTSPGKVFEMATPFHVIDAITVTNFTDKQTGEVKVKHIFKLEMPDARILYVMQSDAPPRATLAEMFRDARALNINRLKAGPYLYEKKDVKQIQPAYVFTQQPGFDIVPY